MELIPPLLTKSQIENKIQEMGETISRDYKNKTHVKVIGLLRGCFVFMADLIRAIDHNLKIDFMEISSYGNEMETSGNVKILKDLTDDIRGEHVIIAEDIIDTGLTLNHVMKMLHTRAPASIEIAALLVKPEKMKLHHPVKYTGFEVGNEFVIGYGLDYKGLMRNLPYIGQITSNDQLKLFEED